MSIRERVRLPNRQLGKIIPLNPEQELPPNIAWAQGHTRPQQTQDALRLLRDNPAVNAVIINSPQRQDIEEIIGHFYNVSPKARIRPSFNHSAAMPVKDRIGAYFNNRSQNPNRDPSKPKNVDLADFEIIAAYGAAVIDDAFADNGIAVLKNTAITFVPCYSGSWGPDGHVNSHVDTHYDFDVRIVEMSYGSPTLIFDDRDFSVMEGEMGGRVMYQAFPVSDVVNAMSIPEGSGIAIRTPSAHTFNMGAMPTVHAHGLGKPNGPERRLTSRHDYCFV